MNETIWVALITNISMAVMLVINRLMSRFDQKNTQQSLGQIHGLVNSNLTAQKNTVKELRRLLALALRRIADMSNNPKDAEIATATEQLVLEDNRATLDNSTTIIKEKVQPNIK